MARHPRDPDDERLVCADVLGAFGVTAADIRREEVSDERLEAVLAEVLADEVDRTSVLRRTITWGDRGFACPPRYSRADLAGELEAVFDAIGWSFTVDPAAEGLELTGTDPRGRTREATVTYPDTPLGDHNLPAVLWTINETILAGTGARFALLSPGRKRWRAGLIEESELERLRDHYGPRIAAFDRPLCPEGGLAAYVSTEIADDATGTAGESPENGGDDGDPWPSWALERDAPRSADATGNDESVSDESGRRAPTVRSIGSTSDGSSAHDGFELRGSPSVSRSDDEGEDESDVRTETDDRTSTADEFGSLSGTSTTARVTNDSFGTDVDWQSEDDRYQALGAALGAGGRVSVRGLLEDDEFLPELPAVEPEETRIEFEDEFDPEAVSEAAATAEESGFEWVDTGSVERTRVSNG
ncbi:hypothetical protein [Natrinema salinisoli]|uniref:hypothetical protein n=1 Tax=Natrinema salinisoli TaxID=2878535 RepID=UPI001CEFC789|nr:hypothetical protein [Natrinema salinisoli]